MEIAVRRDDALQLFAYLIKNTYLCNVNNKQTNNIHFKHSRL